MPATQLLPAPHENSQLPQCALLFCRSTHPVLQAACPTGQTEPASLLPSLEGCELHAPNAAATDTTAAVLKIRPIIPVLQVNHTPEATRLEGRAELALRLLTLVQSPPRQ